MISLGASIVCVLRIRDSTLRLRHCVRVFSFLACLLRSVQAAHRAAEELQGLTLLDPQRRLKQEDAVREIALAALQAPLDGNGPLLVGGVVLLPEDRERLQWMAQQVERYFGAGEDMTESRQFSGPASGAFIGSARKTVK